VGFHLEFQHFGGGFQNERALQKCSDRNTVRNVQAFFNVKGFIPQSTRGNDNSQKLAVKSGTFRKPDSPGDKNDKTGCLRKKQLKGKAARKKGVVEG